MSINGMQNTNVGQYCELFELDLRPISFDMPSVAIITAGTVSTNGYYYITGIDLLAAGLLPGSIITVSGFVDPSANATYAEINTITTTTISNDTFTLKLHNILSIEVSAAVSIVKYPTLLHHFTTAVMPDRSPIVWHGASYQPFPIEAEGFEVSSEGALPTPIIRISNVSRFFSALVPKVGDFVGAKIRRTRTLIEHTDNGINPDPTAHFPIDDYVVNRMVKNNAIMIEWELASAMDQEGRKIPGRQCFRDTCTYVYRQWNSKTATFDYHTANACPYTAGTYFTKNDVSTAAPNLDQCSHQVSGCVARFGNSELPFRGFPGLQMA